MALIIEDGTGIEDANSYVTLAEFIDFASLRGVTLPVEASDQEILLIKASDYLLMFEGDYQGKRKSSTQALSFPRLGLIINCDPYADDKIPQAVKNAQMQAGLEASKGVDLSPSTVKYPVYREKIEEAVERQFMTPRQLSTTPDGSFFSPEFPKVDAFIFPVLRGNECPGTESGAWLKAVRI